MYGRDKVIIYGPGYLSRYIDSLWAGISEDRTQGGMRYSPPFQTGPGTQPASSYTMGTGSFWRGKAAGAWRWAPTQSVIQVEESVELYLYSILWAYVVCSMVHLALRWKYNALKRGDSWWYCVCYDVTWGYCLLCKTHLKNTAFVLFLCCCVLVVRVSRCSVCRNGWGWTATKSYIDKYYG